MLKDEYILKVKKDRVLRTKIMLVCGISHATIYNWINSKSERLSTSDVLFTISEHLHIPINEIVEEPKIYFSKAN